MQFAYQFPEMVERLVLVSSGGLGPEVSPVLRAAALPGRRPLHRRHRRRRRAGSARRVGRGLGRVGLRPNADVAEVARGYASLADPERRAAFLATAARGDRHRRPARRRRSTASTWPRPLPVLIVWGAQRPDHPRRPRRATPTPRSPAAASRSSRTSATCPSSRRPGRFVAALERFLAETEPAEFDREEWRPGSRPPRASSADPFHLVASSGHFNSS